MRHPHAQDTQPHSLVKGGGVGTQRWSIAEIGDRMRSKLAARKWIGKQKGELRSQCRYQNNRFQNKRHLIRKEWIYLKLRVTVPRQSQVNDKTWHSLPEKQHFDQSVDLERAAMHIFLCGQNSRVLVVTITYAGGLPSIELPVSDKATKE